MAYSKWKAISDDEKEVAEVFQGVPVDASWLKAGDAIEHPDGRLWVVTKGGSKNTARCVEGRMKTPTELYD